MSFNENLVAGTVAGVAQVLVGQPFDIVKVRLQSSNLYSGTLDCARQTWREGPATFYRGSTLPIIGMGACVSLQFAFLNLAKQHFIDRNQSSGNSSPFRLSLLQLYSSGAAGGLANSVVATPVEHVRIRLQTQTPLSSPFYNGPLDAIKSIYRSDGLRGIYKGQGITMAREFNGYGIYFAVYEGLVQYNCERDAMGRRNVPVPMAIGFGVAAGHSMWFLNYGFDVIKSRIQTDALLSNKVHQKYSSSLQCAKMLWQEAGIKGFSRGLTPTLIRSPFVNGCSFAVFELTMRAIQ